MAEKRIQQPVKKKGSLVLIFSIGFVVILVMSLPTVLLVFLGLLPTFVAYVVDLSPKKNAAFCVGGINLCGVFPFMMELWTGENTMSQSIDILTNPYSLIVMFGASALGWMVYQSLPPVVAAFLTVIAQRRVSTLRNNQRNLIKEWGEDVSTPQEVIDLRDDVNLASMEPDSDKEIEEVKAQSASELAADALTAPITDDDLVDNNTPAAPSVGTG
ncbi:MAG: hypothetical protein HQ504_13550 [Rhodospirillaceae bacterium]|nr:hypothetical protein [Rhodospirillaceae bacterium]